MPLLILLLPPQVPFPLCPLPLPRASQFLGPVKTHFLQEVFTGLLNKNFALLFFRPYGSYLESLTAQRMDPGIKHSGLNANPTIPWLDDYGQVI